MYNEIIYNITVLKCVKKYKIKYISKYVCGGK